LPVEPLELEQPSATAMVAARAKVNFVMVASRRVKVEA
jgi:hypothetical protein